MLKFLFRRYFLSTKRAGSFNQHTTPISRIYSLLHLLFSKYCWIIPFFLKSFLLWFYLSDWLQLIINIFSFPLLLMYRIQIKDRIWFNLWLSQRYLYISIILYFQSYGEREGTYLCMHDLCVHIRKCRSL